HRLVGRGEQRPVWPARARPWRTAGHRRPVRRHLLDPLADVRLHRLPDRGLGDRQPGRDEGDDGPRHRRQGDAGADHQAQARRGRCDAAGAAQGPDHGTRCPGSVRQAGRALVHAFETGALAPERAFFLRAELAPFRDIDAEQSFRPEYLRLKKAGWSVVPRIESGAYPLGQLLLTKHKEENVANIARAWSLLAEGGTLVCAGSNDDGAASLEKQVGKAFGLDGTLSKFHCRVFWLTRAEKNPPDYWRELAALRPVRARSRRSAPPHLSLQR